VLVFHCKSCDYTEDADPSDWCVYRNEVHHTSKERTVILQVWRDSGMPHGSLAPGSTYGLSGWPCCVCKAARVEHGYSNEDKSNVHGSC